MGFTRILFATLLFALILLISSQVTAKDLAETTKTKETSLFPVRFPPIFPRPPHRPIFTRPPRVPKPRCCPHNNCRKYCACCYSASEAMDADVQAETQN